MDSDAFGHTLLLPFDTSHPEFARGFELGRLWAIARSTEDEIVETIHATNLEMLLRVAEAMGRRVAVEDIDDTWVTASLSPPAVLD